MSLEIIKIALQSLWGHKFRTLLTVLSVTIGSFSIVVMMSLAESGSMTLARSVEEIGGARLVWWVPSPPREKRDLSVYSRGITRHDAQLIEKLPYVKTATGMGTYSQQTAYVSADNTLKLDVVGILPGLLDGLTWPIANGRQFEPQENDQYARVCILSDGVARNLFKDENPVGQLLTVLGRPYKVVGVLKKRKMLMNVGLGFDWDNSIFIPLSTAEKREGLSTDAVVLIAFTEDAKHNPTVISLGTSALLSRHNGVEDFQSINFGEIVGSFNQFFKVASLIVGIIAGISLLAGGIGVMNIMLVSVTERVREIGIRKALGASIIVILTQFLGEAVVLSTLGGLIGVLLGLGTTFVAHMALVRWSEFWVGHYSTLGIALSLGVTTAIGLFFGAVPALQAARLDIVECLRR